MSETFNILIADNNRNIRDLLKREMKVAGHKVKLSKSAEEVFSIMDYQWVPFDFIIIDPIFPDCNEHVLMKKLLSSRISSSVIVHTLYPEQFNYWNDSDKLMLIEKQENSMETIRKIILN
jgi:DNA-binding NtrC family response regulator